LTKLVQQEPHKSKKEEDCFKGDSVPLNPCHLASILWARGFTGRDLDRYFAQNEIAEIEANENLQKLCCTTSKNTDDYLSTYLNII